MNYINIPGSENEYFVLFHGTGGNEYSLLSVVGDLNPNASVISFLGDTSTGVNRRFFASLEEGSLLRDSFNNKVDQFLILWDSIKPLKAKMTFLGYSNGANFMLGILEKSPTIADNVVLMHPSNLGYTFKDFSSCSLLMTSGATDTISLPSESLQLSKQLSNHFYPVSFELLDSGHEVTAQEVSKIATFLKNTK